MSTMEAEYDACVALSQAYTGMFHLLDTVRATGRGHGVQVNKTSITRSTKTMLVLCFLAVLNQSQST